MGWRRPRRLAAEHFVTRRHHHLRHPCHRYAPLGHESGHARRGRACVIASRRSEGAPVPCVRLEGRDASGMYRSSAPEGVLTSPSLFRARRRTGLRPCRIARPGGLAQLPGGRLHTTLGLWLVVCDLPGDSHAVLPHAVSLRSHRRPPSWQLQALPDHRRPTHRPARRRHLARPP
jgi:hypothetical protein